MTRPVRKPALQRFAILGSGFGLYGYLPALAGEFQVLLPQRYRPRFESRTELSPFAPKVQWLPDEATAIAAADAVVLALRPENQEYWLARCIEKRHPAALLLEKPLARSPQLARKLHDALVSAGLSFRIGYLFPLTTWGRTFKASLEGMADAPAIRWRFLAHHYRSDVVSWKRSAQQGGGAIRFYGTQVIGLLALAGYREVSVSTAFGPSSDEIDAWQASFTGQGLQPCNVVVDSRCTADSFEASVFGGSHRAGGPFDVAPSGAGIDARATLLATVCRSLAEPDDAFVAWYRRTIDLWEQAESKARFNHRKPGSPLSRA